VTRRVATLFVPCFVDHLHHEVARASITLLEAAGMDVDVPTRQTCCGQPALNFGAPEAASRAARHFARVFRDAETVVCPSGSCVRMVRSQHPRLAPGGLDVSRLHEIFSFLDGAAGLPEARCEARAVLHAPCHHARSPGGMDPARKLASRVHGLELLEWRLAEECCGFGGLFSIEFPRLSTAMGLRKVEGLVQRGVEWIVTPDASCQMHLDGIVRAHGLPITVVHLAEVLAQTARRREDHGRHAGRPAGTKGAEPALVRRVNEKLEIPGLADRVARAADHSLERRASIAASIKGWDGIRDRAARIRREALERLDEHLGSFRKRAAASGVEIHDAADAAQACGTVLGILREANAGTAIKSKSMVGEEIGLGEALARSGIDVVETDLGEFIVQLGHEPPSHITAPALHVDVREVARRFLDHGVIDATPPELEGETLSERDRAGAARAMALAARSHLRKAFLGSPAGITGANFLVAETGTVVLVENESNIRLATTLPRVHVAVTGIEKVVPAAADLAPLLTLLPVSATGQRQSAAVSLLGSPRRGARMHVVLVDAGRRALLADEVLGDALACIRCGACMNVCPVFRTVGGHAYGGPYPGPLGLMLLEELGDSHDPLLPFLSTLCGACADVCPVRIPIPDVILELRRRHLEAGLMGLRWKAGLACFGLLAASPPMWSLASRIGSWALRRGARPGPLASWAAGRALPRPTGRRFVEAHGRKE